MKYINYCRSCRSKKLENLFSLGKHYYTGIFPQKKNSKIPIGELKLIKCKKCSLVQLAENFNFKKIYGENYGYRTGLNLSMVNHIKKKKIPIICFPKGIKKENYVDFCSIVNPSAISIDYNIDPEWIKDKVNNTPIQGGMDPKILLTEKKNIKKKVNKYLDIFSGYPYIFNLGHGVLPDTDPSIINFVIKTIRERNK